MIYEDDAHPRARTSRRACPARAGGSQAHTLDELLAAFAKSNGKRPRLVHRLDRDTSGVILAAKTKPAAAFLGKAMMGRRVDEDLPGHRRARRARAAATGVIEAPLRRDEQGREAYMRVCAADHPDAETASHPLSHPGRRRRARRWWS